MANIKSNIKTIRKTERKTRQNRIVKTTYKNNVKHAKATGAAVDVNLVYSNVDSALAKGVITKNKADRIKSRVAKQANKTAKK